MWIPIYWEGDPIPSWQKRLFDWSPQSERYIEPNKTGRPSESCPEEYRPERDSRHVDVKVGGDKSF